MITNRGFKDRFTRDIDYTITKNDEIFKKDIKEFNLLLGDIFKELGYNCKGCLDCCCRSCDANNAYYSSYNNMNKMMVRVFKDDILKVLENKKSESWDGFYDKEKGCMLPREIRSWTCNTYTGIPNKCFDKKFEHIVTLMNSMIRKVGDDMHKYHYTYNSTIGNSLYDFKNILQIIKQLKKLKDETTIKK